MIVERAKQFGKEHNVEVSVEAIAYEDFFPKWTAAIESGNTPDVSFFGYQEVGQFYAQGVLEETTDLVKRIEEKNGPLYDSMKSAVTFDGKMYGVPFWAESMVLYYRKDLFEKAGLQGPPETWEQFREYAKLLTDPANGIYGAGIGYGKGNSDAEWFTRSVIWSYGGSVDAKDGVVIVNSPETVEAAQFIVDIFLKDQTTPPSAVGWDDSGNNRAYLSGQAAMIFNTGSVLNTVKNEDPELYANTGIAPMPAGPKGSFIPGISNNFGIFKNSKNKELAKEFIAYLLDADWYRTWIETGVPLNCPVYPALAEESIWQDPYYKGFVESVPSFKFLGYPSDYSPAAGEVYNLRYVNDAFMSMLVDNVTPAKAIATLHDQVESVYNK
ncbi:MAG: sugar ABC transporter substrate-binding protein [Symbiobacterium sp.]|uniref:sugar ABC transporter substrate-binding protein n=1 Tax=Symbiobacterium sp. TaxID=1971213 RepID=UPI003463F4BF